MNCPYRVWKPHDCIQKSQKSQNLGVEILCLQSPSFLVPRPQWLREARRPMGMKIVNNVLFYYFHSQCFPCHGSFASKRMWKIAPGRKAWATLELSFVV